MSGLIATARRRPVIRGTVTENGYHTEVHFAMLVHDKDTFATLIVSLYDNMDMVPAIPKITVYPDNQNNLSQLEKDIADWKTSGIDWEKSGDAPISLRSIIGDDNFVQTDETALSKFWLCFIGQFKASLAGEWWKEPSEHVDQRAGEFIERAHRWVVALLKIQNLFADLYK